MQCNEDKSGWKCPNAVFYRALRQLHRVQPNSFICDPNFVTCPPAHPGRRAGPRGPTRFCTLSTRCSIGGGLLREENCLKRKKTNIGKTRFYAAMGPPKPRKGPQRCGRGSPSIDDAVYEWIVEFLGEAERTNVCVNKRGISVLRKVTSAIAYFLFDLSLVLKCRTGVVVFRS